jgi:hypothetical protein
LKFSRIAAGKINTREIQLQFLLNHASLSVRFNPSTRTMERSPQGNTRNKEGFLVAVAIKDGFDGGR